MLPVQSYAMVVVSLVVAVIISYFSMPSVIRLAKKIGAIDVPSDGRRMHTHPIPRLGGLAIIAAFLVSAVICSFYQNLALQQILPGAAIIAAMGVLDDRKSLPPWPKFFVQCVAAGIAVLSGVRVTGISFFDHMLQFQYLSIPLTILWIVGITNAVNFIDGLDGLAAGVASIASVSMLVVALMRGQVAVALLTAALAGGCIGLLPYNRNPARVFMGDTGATFLGFVLSIISIQGLFKYYAAASFLLPLLILGLPIFDTASAIVRRLWEHKSPFTPDRNHVHHKLIDMGLTQKQAVRSLYLVSAVLGVVAITFASVSVTTGMHFLIIGTVLISLIYLSLVLWAKRRNSQKAENTENTVENAPVDLLEKQTVQPQVQEQSAAAQPAPRVAKPDVNRDDEEPRKNAL